MELGYMKQDITVLIGLLLVEIQVPIFSMQLPRFDNDLKVRKYGMQKKLLADDEIVMLVQYVALQAGKSNATHIVIENNNNSLADLKSRMCYKEDVIVIPVPMERALRKSMRSKRKKEQRYKYRFLGSLLHEFGHIEYEKQSFQELHHAPYNPVYWHNSEIILKHMGGKNISSLLDQLAERLHNPTKILAPRFIEVLVFIRKNKTSLDEKYASRILETQADNFACLCLATMKDQEQAIEIAQTRADYYRKLHTIYEQWYPHLNEGKGTHPTPQSRSDQFKKNAWALRRNSVMKGIERAKIWNGDFGSIFNVSNKKF